MMPLAMMQMLASWLRFTRKFPVTIRLHIRDKLTKHSPVTENGSMTKKKSKSCTKTSHQECFVASAELTMTSLTLMTAEKLAGE